MELVKNIFFNTDKIIENTRLKISYVGDLYQEGYEDVFIHYGFGYDWQDIADIKMEKTELGFQCEIEIGESDSLNFCFNNGADVWDNNNGENYVFPIEKIELKEIPEELAMTITSDTGMELHRGLRKSYIWSKKIRLAVYKLLHYVPKLISGNYKRKFNEQ